MERIFEKQQPILIKDAENQHYPYSLPLGRKAADSPELVDYFLQVAKPLYPEIKPEGDSFVLPNPLLDAWIHQSPNKSYWLRRGYGTVFYVDIDIPFGESFIEVVNSDEVQCILPFTTVKPEAVCRGILVSMNTYAERDEKGRIANIRRSPLIFQWKAKVKRKVFQGETTYSADGSLTTATKGSK